MGWDTGKTERELFVIRGKIDPNKFYIRFPPYLCDVSIPIPSEVVKKTRQA